MKSYALDQIQDDLNNLPSLHDTPGYEVIEGDPRCSIRMDRGTQLAETRLGVWMCTPGAFRCVEKGDELQTIIEGRLIIILEDGSRSEFGPGDSFFTVSTIFQVTRSPFSVIQVYFPVVRP